MKIKRFDEFVNENIDLKSEYAIGNLFRKYDTEFEPEFNSENWIEFHYRGGGGLKALKESLELIGDGEIIDKGNNSLMYKEMLKDDTIIFIVHASLSKSPYGGAEGYYYEIGVYKNDPTTSQIGGGYGASGIITTSHTNLLHYSDYDKIHYNRNVISKVCDDIKNNLNL